MTVTSPPVSVTLKLCDFNHARQEMSCVLPSCGVAIFFPRKSAAVLIGESAFTTRAAPALAAPETTRISSPFDLKCALSAGPGPTYVTSSDPAKMASIAEGPALYVNH